MSVATPTAPRTAVAFRAGMYELPPVEPCQSWTRADERFLWNRHMLEDFLDARDSLPEVDGWVAALINGFVACKEVSFGAAGPPAQLLLVSRRSRHRQGTRFHRRGIDASNNVANFVETEEVLLFRDGRMASVVQIRGSIPVYWTQEPTLKYTPTCTVHPGVTEEHVKTHPLCVCVCV